MMYVWLLGALGVLMVLAAPAVSLAGVKAVWAVNDGEKVDRDDLANRNKAANSAWDGKKITLFGARNEIVAFQVIVETDDKGVGELSVSLPELRLRGGDARLVCPPAPTDPTDYRGRDISLFSVNYTHVTEPSNAFWVYKPGSPAAPKNPTGWKSVQIVPAEARPGKGGFPLAVGPRSNQPFWIEVYTRKDLLAGIYEGTVAVTADGKAASVPVEFELFDFALPDANTVDVMVYFESYQLPMYHGKALDAAYHRFAHRNRIELVSGYTQASAKAAEGRLKGTDFAKAKGYEGPGEGVGNHIIPASFYGPGEGYDEKRTAWSQSDAWMKFLAKEYPRAVTFLYMPDEPSPKEFDTIRKLAGNVHSNGGPGKALPIFVTKEYTPELVGAIDIWCSGMWAYDIKRAEEERAHGRKAWVYNGTRPFGGALLIDVPATDARANLWACFKHGIDLYFVWHGNHWQHNWQKQGERKQNVWVNPVTFDNIGQPNKTDQGTCLGDGVLMYPGEENVHPEEDRGIAGPCSSVQLANIRRGAQDHAYLTIASNLGLTAVVKESVDMTVPRVFSDAGEAVGFAEDGNTYERARYSLAKAIAGASRQKK